MHAVYTQDYIIMRNHYFAWQWLLFICYDYQSTLCKLSGCGCTLWLSIYVLTAVALQSAQYVLYVLVFL